MWNSFTPFVTSVFCARLNAMLTYSLALMICSPATAKPWEDVIPEVAELGTSYIERAERLFEANFDALFDADTAMAYEGSIAKTLQSVGERIPVKERHECGILGRMLGVPELVEDYERIEVPDPIESISIDYIFALWSAGRSYELWADQARQLVAQDLSKKVQYWNIECRSSDLISYPPLFIVSSGPSYDEFPTKSYLTDDHPIPDIDTAGWSDWEIDRSLPRIQGALEQGPNFAGHYSAVMQSCGGSCAYYDFVDVKTGRFFSPPLGGESTAELALDFNKDSQLIYAIYMQSSDSCLLQAWSYDGSEFRMEHEQTFERNIDAGCRTWNFRVITE